MITKAEFFRLIGQEHPELLLDLESLYQLFVLLGRGEIPESEVENKLDTILINQQVETMLTSVFDANHHGNHTILSLLRVIADEENFSREKQAAQASRRQHSETEQNNALKNTGRPQSSNVGGKLAQVDLNHPKNPSTIKSSAAPREIPRLLR